MSKHLSLKQPTKKNSIKAFSLVETLIFITIFSLFFVVAASIVSTTLRITKINQSRIQALHYAEELNEWLQAEKEIDWGGLVSTESSVNGFTERTTQSNPESPETSFCFNTFPISIWPEKGTANCAFTLDSKYRRIATFSASVDPMDFVKQIHVSLSVDWVDGNMVYSVPIQNTFSIWE